MTPEDLETVEVSRGASTSVFGDLAMGGVISLFSRPVEGPLHGTLGFESGSNGTNEIAGSAAGLWGHFGASMELRTFDSDGYFIVPDYLQGAADRRANLRLVAGATRLEWSAAHDQVFLKLDMLAEERQNGTALTNNSTSLGTLSAHYSHELPQGVVSVLAWHTQEDYRSTYSAISADRNVETLTDRQKVPSEATGAGAVRPALRAVLALNGAHHGGGADFERVEGYSHDAAPNRPAAVAGGTQVRDGVFGQFDVAAGPR